METIKNKADNKRPKENKKYNQEEVKALQDKKKKQLLKHETVKKCQK